MDLEKAEEPDIKFPTSTGSKIKLPTSTGSKKTAREFQKSIYFCFIDYTRAFVWIKINWKTLNYENAKKTYLSPERPACQIRSNIQYQKWNNGWVQNWERGTVHQAVYCHSAYLNYMHSTSKQNARLDGAQAGINIPRRIINNFRYADDNNLMAESKEQLKRFLMKVKQESEKSGLKLSIQKTKIMASSHITSWKEMGEKWKQ